MGIQVKYSNKKIDTVEFSIKNVLPYLAIYFTPKFGVGKIGFW